MCNIQHLRWHCVYSSFTTTFAPSMSTRFPIHTSSYVIRFNTAHARKNDTVPASEVRLLPDSATHQAACLPDTVMLGAVI